MATKIDDRIKLLGLIATTIPFDYENNNLTATYNLYIEISELETLKNNLLEQLSEGSSTEEEKISINEDIYFLDKTIEFLNSKL